MRIDPAEMKRARESLGLTQTQLGRMLDPPARQTVIAKYERGEYQPRGRRREQIMAALSIGESDNPIRQAGEISMPRHELVGKLLAMRTDIDNILSRV
jgi:predicted transcriptional regulator